MSDSAPRFTLVEETDDTTGRDAPLSERKGAEPEDRSFSVKLLALSLQALSQRALVALSALFTAGALFSAWWLWNETLPAPTGLQLVGLAMYGAFILALEWVRRRK